MRIFSFIIVAGLLCAGSASAKDQENSLGFDWKFYAMHLGTIAGNSEACNIHKRFELRSQLAEQASEVFALKGIRILLAQFDMEFERTSLLDCNPDNIRQSVEFAAHYKKKLKIY